MYAILRCVSSNDLCHRHNDSIAICTDSQAALKALSFPEVISALVVETVSALCELAIHNSVRLVWVPGYHGIPVENVLILILNSNRVQFLHTESVPVQCRSDSDLRSIRHY